MNKIKVEKGIPYKSNRKKYPWDKMEAGDSFFVATDNPDHMQSVVRSAGSQWVKRNGVNVKVVTKRVTKDNEEGVRVWFIDEE